MRTTMTVTSPLDGSQRHGGASTSSTGGGSARLGRLTADDARARGDRSVPSPSPPYWFLPNTRPCRRRAAPGVPPADQQGRSRRQARDLHGRGRPARSASRRPGNRAGCSPNTRRCGRAGARRRAHRPPPPAHLFEPHHGRGRGPIELRPIPGRPFSLTPQHDTIPPRRARRRTAAPALIDVESPRADTGAGCERMFGVVPSPSLPCVPDPQQCAVPSLSQAQVVAADRHAGHVAQRINRARRPSKDRAAVPYGRSRSAPAESRPNRLEAQVWSTTAPLDDLAQGRRLTPEAGVP